MAIINPLKVIITNYPSDEIEYVEAVNNMEMRVLELIRWLLVKCFILKRRFL